MKVVKDKKGNEKELSDYSVLVELNQATGIYKEAVKGVRNKNCTYTYMDSVPKNNKILEEAKLEENKTKSVLKKGQRRS